MNYIVKDETKSRIRMFRTLQACGQALLLVAIRGVRELLFLYRLKEKYVVKMQKNYSNLPTALKIQIVFQNPRGNCTN